MQQITNIENPNCSRKLNDLCLQPDRSRPSSRALKPCKSLRHENPKRNLNEKPSISVNAFLLSLQGFQGVPAGFLRVAKGMLGETTGSRCSSVVRRDNKFIDEASAFPCPGCLKPISAPDLTRDEASKVPSFIECAPDHCFTSLEFAKVLLRRTN